MSGASGPLLCFGAQLEQILGVCWSQIFAEQLLFLRIPPGLSEHLQLLAATEKPN